ncbi:MAG: hypothetical protein PHO46_04260 [Thermoguttaceae bacterium]|nr:hypothetical protein [Thermoguttaceae bacterium]
MLAVWVVDSLADPGVSGDNLTTLREAIAIANSGDTITFDPSIIGGKIVLSPAAGAGKLKINKSLTIDGWALPGEPNMPLKEFEGVIICGTDLYYPGTGNEEMMEIKGNNINVTLRGLTFANSKTVQEMTGIIDNQRDGIAINCNSGVDLSIENCSFIRLKYGAYGPLRIAADNFTITNTLIADNIALSHNCHTSSGLYFEGGTGAMYNCTVANNSVRDDLTGALEYGVYNNSNTAFSVHNSIVVGHETSDFRAKKAALNVTYTLYEKPGTNPNVNIGIGSIQYAPATHGAIFTAEHNGYCKSRYWLAPSSIAINNGHRPYVSNTNGYNLNAQNNQRGYDLAGNWRLKGATEPYDVDMGAFSAGWVVVPMIVVTIEEDIVNHSDDFYADGSPRNISLREAYEYVGRYYYSGNLNDFANSFAVTDGTQPLSEVYSTIRFADNVENCYLTSEIFSEKNYAIVGTRPIPADNVTIHGTVSRSNPAAGDGLAATDATRLFNVRGNTTITATDLNLKNTYARASQTEETTSSTYGKGGALYIAANANFLANGVGFSNNYAVVSGGAVFVEPTGFFRGSNVNLSDNQSLRGGAIANFGTANLINVNTLANNKASVAVFNGAPGFDATVNPGFGGAIYNAGELNIAALNQPQCITTFTGNKALSEKLGASGQLVGGSGGAIYNTVQGGVSGVISAYNAVFNTNTSSKYGGAISNFGALAAANVTFQGNESSAGGALQNSGTATITGATFDTNKALLYRNSSLTSNGQDYGGNGGAIFASGADKSVTIQDRVIFKTNEAENAGGAIDYINGSLTFNNADVDFQGNKATVIGGAVIATKPITFANSTFAFDFVNPLDPDGPHIENTARYAPNVAVAVGVRDDAINAMAQAFFPTAQSPVDRKLLDTFTRYGETTSEHKLTFSALAESFTYVPTKIYVKLNNAADYPPLGPNDPPLSGLTTGPNVVEYYSHEEPAVVFHAHINVVDPTTSIVASQINLAERAYISGGDNLATGVSLRVYSTVGNPVPIRQ